METITINPRGDVGLIIGGLDKQTEHIVNSAVLRLSSRIFDALLGGHFTEARAFASRIPGTDPFRIELPDDDVEAVGVHLKMLHPVPVPDGMFEPELQALAVMVDKYQCQAACVVYAPAGMKTLLYRFGFNLGLANFVGLAIAFRSHEVFALATMGVALTSAGFANEHEPNHLAVRYRIEHTPLAHMIPDDMINRIEELRPSSSPRSSAL